MFRKLLAAAATVLLAAGASVVAITAPAAAATTSPLSSLAGFTILTEGDLTTSGSASEVEGSAAVGGNLVVNKNYILGGTHNAALPVLESRNTQLLVAGAVTLAVGGEAVDVNSGATRVGTAAASDYGVGSASTSTSTGNRFFALSDTSRFVRMASSDSLAQVSAGSLFSTTFGTAFSTLRSNSSAIAALASPTVSLVTLIDPTNYNGLSGSDKGVALVSGTTNVLRVTAAQLSAITNIQMKGANPSSSTPFIIDVTDAGSVSITAPKIMNVDASSVLWNFAGATTLNLDGREYIEGSILAPNAAVNFLSGAIEGQVAVKSLVISSVGEIHHIGYNGGLPTPMNAAGSYSFTDGACAVGTGTATTNSLTVNAVDHIKYTWTAGPLTGDFTSYSSSALAAGTYAFSVTALDGYALTGDTSFSHQFLTVSNCSTETTPTCLPASAVSYTYLPATNSGVISVVNPDTTRYSDTLCDGFWVTATSWKYSTENTWPQTRDVVQKLDEITKVGTYDYAAAVSCGQGDIYASFTVQPDPPQELTAPGDPWSEHFLHDLGFTGPNPTYVQQVPGCNEVTPGIASSTNQACVSGAVVGGSITVGLETGLVYSIDGPGTASDVSPVTTKTTSNLPAGSYTVSVAATAGYVLTGAGSWPRTFPIAAAANCAPFEPPTEPLITPSATMKNLSCVALGSYTLGPVDGVLWTVDGIASKSGSFDVTTAKTVTISAAPDAPAYGFEPGIDNPSTWTFEFTTPKASDCPMQLTTLAYTGMATSGTLVLAGGLVFVGLAGMLIARRRWTMN